MAGAGPLRRLRALGVFLTLALPPGVAAGATAWVTPLGTGEAQSQAVPSAPTGASASWPAPTTSKTIKVGWNAVPHASTYAIYRSTISAYAGYSVTATGITSSPWTSGTLTANTPLLLRGRRLRRHELVEPELLGDGPDHHQQLVSLLHPAVARPGRFSLNVRGWVLPVAFRPTEAYPPNQRPALCGTPGGSMAGGNTSALADTSSRIAVFVPGKGVPTVFLRGAAVRCAEELRRTFRRLGHHHRSVVVDATDAPLIDGGVLIAIVTADDRLPGGVRIRGASDWVHRLFVLAGRQRMLLSSFAELGGDPDPGERARRRALEAGSTRGGC